MPVFFTYPLTVKVFFSIVSPWLVGCAAVGALAGRLSVDSEKSCRKINRLASELKRLDLENKALTEKLETLRFSSSDVLGKREALRTMDHRSSIQKKPTTNLTKASLLKDLLESNLIVRKKMN